MGMHIKHYLLSSDGGIQEFTSEEAARVANGFRTLPQYADSRARYVQVAFDEPDDDDDIRVRTAGACLCFDAHGRLTEATSGDDCEETLSRFEHDTCVQLALRDTPYMHDTVH